MKGVRPVALVRRQREVLVERHQSRPTTSSRGTSLKCLRKRPSVAAQSAIVSGSSIACSAPSSSRYSSAYVGQASSTRRIAVEAQAVGEATSPRPDRR